MIHDHPWHIAFLDGALGDGAFGYEEPMGGVPQFIEFPSNTLGGPI